MQSEISLAGCFNPTEASLSRGSQLSHFQAADRSPGFEQERQSRPAQKQHSGGEERRIEILATGEKHLLQTAQNKSTNAPGREENSIIHAERFEAT